MLTDKEWKALPDWVMWVATDENKRMWGYDCDPEKDEMALGWDNIRSRALMLGIDDSDTPWRESKQRRPEVPAPLTPEAIHAGPATQAIKVDDWEAAYGRGVARVIHPDGSVQGCYKPLPQFGD